MNGYVRLSRAPSPGTSPEDSKGARRNEPKNFPFVKRAVLCMCPQLRRFYETKDLRYNC